MPPSDAAPPANTTTPSPARPGSRWSGYALLFTSAVLGLVWGYFVYLRVTSPTPPAIDFGSVEPMVADVLRAAHARVVAQPRDPAAWGELGMVLHAHDLHDQAMQCYTQAERFDPNSPFWPYLLGCVAGFVGAPNDSIDAFSRAVGRAGDEPTPRLRLGEALLEQGRHEEAESCFQEVLRSTAGSAQAHLGLARIQLARGDAQASLEHVQKCLRTTGDFPAACDVLAQAHHALGDQASAAEARTRARRIKKQHFWPDPYLDQVANRQTGTLSISRRAVALFQAGRGDEAQTLLEEFVRRFPESAVARGELGRLYIRRGMHAAAEPHFREALRLDPARIDLHYQLALCLMNQNKPAEAVPEFRRVVEGQPDNGEAHLRLGQSLYALGDTPGAAQAFEEAIRFIPNNLVARRQLGIVLGELRRYAEAVDHLEQAAMLAPEDEQVKRLLARARERLETPDK